jgi:aminoglycoside 2''-phosphotransferase
MDAEEARRALRSVGIDATAVRPIGDGWANWTFLVDGHLVVRFPRNPEVGDATRRELRLLPALRSHVSFAIPEPTVVGEHGGLPFFGYESIDGRALRAGDGPAAGAIGRVLAELHRFPVDRAAELLGSPPPGRAWRDRYESLWPVVEQVALPELDPATADEVRWRYAGIVEAPPAFPTCLIHNDLGPEHVLLDLDGRPVGLIDFEDAALGDPATDLVALLACLGRHTLTHLLAGRDLGERLDERLHFYRWMGSVHAIVYGVREEQPDALADGRRELPRRLAARP